MKYKLVAGSVQHRFNQSRVKVQIFGGGFGNGKSAAICVKAIGLALGYPGSNGLLGRATYAKLNDTLRKEFFKWCPANVIARMPTTTDNTLYFKNGSVVNFRYIAQRGKKTFDSQTTSNLLSATYDWAGIDQIEDPEIVYKDFLDIMGRMRGTTPYKGSDPTMPLTGPRFVMLACNPTGNWVYSKLVKPYHDYVRTGLVTPELIHDQNTLEPMIEVFEGPTSDNAHNLEDDFLIGLQATYKGQMYDRFVLGKWASYEGLVYPDFAREIHMIPRNVIDRILTDRWRERTRFQAVQAYDHGMVVPSCYLFGFVDDIGRVFWIDGFYEPGLTEGKIAAKIQEIQAKYEAFIEIVDPIWADPQIFKKNQLKGESITSIASLLSDHGLYLKPGQNSITSGITKVAGYLAVQELNGLLDPSMPGPNMYFCDELTFVAEEMLGYFWKTNPSGDRIDEPVDRNDHACDAVKYGLSYCPDPSELIFIKPALTPEHLKWQERP